MNYGIGTSLLKKWRYTAVLEKNQKGMQRGGGIRERITDARIMLLGLLQSLLEWGDNIHMIPSAYSLSRVHEAL